MVIATTTSTHTTVTSSILLTIDTGLATSACRRSAHRRIDFAMTTGTVEQLLPVGACNCRGTALNCTIAVHACFVVGI